MSPNWRQGHHEPCLQSLHDLLESGHEFPKNPLVQIQRGLRDEKTWLGRHKTNQDLTSISHKFQKKFRHKHPFRLIQTTKMADEEDIAALVVDNGSGMCKGQLHLNAAGIVILATDIDENPITTNPCSPFNTFELPLTFCPFLLFQY